VLLYSGGLDAAASLLANRGRVGLLASVRGADVPLAAEELWALLDRTIAGTDVARGVERAVITSNFRSFPVDRRLNHDFIRDISPDWWGRVHHGMGLLCLLAPLTAVRGLSRVYIASSHSAGFRVPWGSSPELDALVRWSAVSVVHDGFDLTRQGKIARWVAPELRSGHDVTMRVCSKPTAGPGNLNCCSCEKCIRTASGLIVEGVDPAVAGLPVTMDVLDAWKLRLSEGERRLNGNELFMWQDVQCGARAATSVLSPYEDYCQWLRTFDFAPLLRDHVTVWNRALFEVGYLLRGLLDHMPASVQSIVRNRVDERRKA